MPFSKHRYRFNASIKNHLVKGIRCQCVLLKKHRVASLLPTCFVLYVDQLSQCVIKRPVIPQIMYISTPPTHCCIEPRFPPMSVFSNRCCGDVCVSIWDENI